MSSLDKAFAKAAPGLAAHVNTYFLEGMIAVIPPVDHQRPATSRNLTGSIDCAVDKGALKLFRNLVEMITLQSPEKPTYLIHTLEGNMKQRCEEWASHENKLLQKYRGLPLDKFEEKDKAQRETHWRRTALAIALHEVAVLDKKVRQNLWAEYQKWYINVGDSNMRLYYMSEDKAEVMKKTASMHQDEPKMKSKKRKSDSPFANIISSDDAEPENSPQAQEMSAAALDTVVPAASAVTQEESHQDLPRPYKCPLCDKAFHRLAHQKGHMNLHTGEKPYACQFPGCTKRYNRSENLIRHSRIHKDQMPHACQHPGCTKRFSRSDELMCHSRTHKDGNFRQGIEAQNEDTAMESDIL